MPKLFPWLAVLGLGLFGLAGCGYEISLGPGDGIDEIRHEELVEREAFAAGTVVELSRDLVILDEEQSREYLERFGADKIGSITAVDLTLVEARADGGVFEGPPVVTMAGETMSRTGTRVSLHEVHVDALRAGILGGTPVVMPVSILLTVAGGPPDLARWAASVHIVVVVQPTLHVDATRSL